MCFYYALVKKDPGQLVKSKVIDGKQLEMFDEAYLVNGFENPKLPILKKKGELSFSEWGLVPKYSRSKDEAERFRKKYNTLNAKGETIFKSKIYSDAIMHRRCLVICSGFFEWRSYKGKKYPYYITLKKDEVFVFGGIWNEYTDRETGEISGTYAIITIPANHLLAQIHNVKKRMPLVILPEMADKWLTPGLSKEEIMTFFIPLNSKYFKAHTIKKFIPSKTEEFNKEDLIAYYHYPELLELNEEDIEN